MTFQEILLSSSVTLKMAYTREDFLIKNIVAVSFFQLCAIHPYS